jgi:O-antigen ligase
MRSSRVSSTLRNTSWALGGGAMVLLVVALVPTFPFVALLPVLLLAGIWVASNLLTRGLFVLILARTLSDSAAVPEAFGALLNTAIAGFALLMLIAQLLAGEARLGKFALWVIGGVLAFSFVGIFSFGINGDLLGDSLRIISIVSVGSLSVAAATTRGPKVLMGILLGASVPSALLAVVGWASHSPLLYSSATGRAFGTFPHPVAAAGYFSVLALVALYAYFEYRNRWSGPLLILFCVAVLGTASLGGLATLAAGTLALLLLLPNGTRAKWTAIWALVAGGGVLLAVAGQSLLERISVLRGTSLLAELDGTGATNSTTWRFRNWLALLDYWQERPFFGWGFGTTSTIIQPLGELPHSGPVRLLVETGTIGFLTFLGIFLAAMVVAIRQLFRSSGSSGAFRIALLIAAFTNALTSNTLGYIPMLMSIGVAWAVGKPTAFLHSSGSRDGADPMANEGLKFRERLRL